MDFSDFDFKKLLIIIALSVAAIYIGFGLYNYLRNLTTGVGFDINDIVVLSAFAAIFLLVFLYISKEDVDLFYIG